ncbi:MAG TPA: FMN-binding negative transcriptional regulator [Jatrophihabitans sp.]|nr:FMN-binding negative transcriptional regulator [Jatrophihabitans sp.]
MYVPAHFAATSDQVQRLLGAGGLVDLVSPGGDGLLCTPLPMLYLPDSSCLGVLQGHLARNNPHWSAVRPGEQSLAIVRGPDAYVSPGWYASKAEHGRVVPTWNYLTAHVYGELVVHEDTGWLRGLVTRLTELHEGRLPAPWQVSDAPAPFIDGQLRAIVGVELVISRIEAKAKLSQNRSEADQAGVVAALGPDSAIGQAMIDSGDQR